ncbi:MAG: hypothetical protein WBW80_16800, partial [Acidimicrobiales bacterium]
PQAQPVAPQAQPVAPQAEPPDQNLATESEVFGTTPPNDAGDSGTDSPAERPAGTEPPRP